MRGVLIRVRLALNSSCHGWSLGLVAGEVSVEPFAALMTALGNLIGEQL